MPKEYIEREMATDAVVSYWFKTPKQFISSSEFAKIINCISTADVVEVVHGEWIDKEYFGIEIPICSVCGWESSHYEYYAYCPDCGAKMDGKDNNNAVD